MGYPQEAMVDNPYLYLPLQDRAGNPVAFGTGGATMALGTDGDPGAFVTYGVTGPSVRRGLHMHLYRMQTSGRYVLTANQTRLAWVRTTNLDATASYAGDAAMTVFGDASGSVWDSFGVHDGKVRFTRFNNSAWQTFDSAKTVADGRWHYIGVTYNSSTRAVTLYVDGVADGSGTMTAHQAQGGVDRIARGFTADYFDGDLADLELFTSVLDSARILSRYRAATRRPSRRVGLVAA